MGIGLVRDIIMGKGVSQRLYHGYRDSTRDSDMGIGVSLRL